MPTITKTEYTQIVAPQDTTPSNFVNFQTNTDQATNVVSTSVAQTILGITGNVSVSVSGQGSPQVSVDGSAFTASSTTIQNNQTIQVRLTTSTSVSTSHTATVTVGTVSRTFTATTSASGQGGSGAGAIGEYGIEIYDTNGTTTVISPSTRYLSFMNDPSSVTVPAASGGVDGSVFIQQDMTGLTTSNSEVAFTDLFGSFDITIERNTTGVVSTQGITLKNSATAAITCTPVILRF